MQKVIITGANGFIGSHLVKRMNEMGVEVIALVDPRFDYSFIKELSNVTIIAFSLQNIDSLYSDERLKDSDIVYHLAWSGVHASYRNNEDEQLQNIKYCLDILKLAKHIRCWKVLIPGSAAEVSCGDGMITGKESPAPSDIYSATKVATRYLCQTYAHQHDIALIWPLITSIYGPGRDDNNLISYAIKTLLRGEKPSFTKLEQQWDYLYIDDLIEALVALGDKGKSYVYPIGSGEHRKMSEYVGIIHQIINPNLSLGIGDIPYKNPNRIDNQMMDISALKRDTGFSPKTIFEEGISKTIDYFRGLSSWRSAR